MDALRVALASEVHPSRPSKTEAEAPFYNAAFFDAYFSNYIEGTKFKIDEARYINDTGLVPVNRPEDGHDIIVTYQLLSNLKDVMRTHKSYKGFIDLLVARHSEIIARRPEKRPGLFNEQENYAGSISFVDYELVEGTLLKGFGLYSSLEHPFDRALLMMFLVTEVHQFEDGNGRTARAMMNSEQHWIKSHAGIERHCLPPKEYKVSRTSDNSLNKMWQLRLFK
jgi:hypothetical protein